MEVVPTLYHLEYYLKEGYLNVSPDQYIKVIVETKVGFHDLYNTDNGCNDFFVNDNIAIFNCGKSVLFAIIHPKESTEIVFRFLDNNNDYLGEGVHSFSGCCFPKGFVDGSPSSFTCDTNVSLSCYGSPFGEIRAFFRLTCFGNAIISDCIQDCQMYRVRLTSLIQEQGEKETKPTIIHLDGRRMRFSTWMKCLERENFAKEVFLRIKKRDKPKKTIREESSGIWGDPEVLLNENENEFPDITKTDSEESISIWGDPGDLPSEIDIPNIVALQAEINIQSMNRYKSETEEDNCSFKCDNIQESGMQSRTENVELLNGNEFVFQEIGCTESDQCIGKESSEEDIDDQDKTSPEVTVSDGFNKSDTFSSDKFDTGLDEESVSDIVGPGMAEDVIDINNNHI